MDELELSIKDLVVKVLLKWRMILIAMLVGAVVFGGIGAVSALNEEVPLSLEDMDVEVLAKEIEIAKGKLSQTEQIKVQAAAQLYDSYEMQYNSTIEYLKDSAIFQLNPECVSVMQILGCVSVDAKDTKAEEASDIVQNYVWALSTESFYKNVANAMGWEMDSSYIREVINVVTESNGTFKVTVLARDEFACKTITKVIEQTIKETKEQAVKLYGSYNISILKDYAETNRSEVFEMQQKQLANLSLLREKQAALDDKFTENQLYYYDAINMYDDASEVETDILPAEQNVDLVNVKYIIIGAVLGALIGCCIAAVQYLFTPFLRKKEDLEFMYGIPTLGTVKSEPRKKKSFSFIDRFIQFIFYGKERYSKEEILQIVISDLKVLAKNKNYAKIAIIGTYNDVETDSLKKQLVEGLHDVAVEVISGGSIVCEADVLEEMNLADAVLIIEKAEGSRYDDIKIEIETCKLHGMEIIGSVILN